MGRLVDVDDLVGVFQIAEILSIPPNTVQQWVMKRRDIGFPEPVVVCNKKTRIFNWPEVEAWWKEYIESNSRAAGKLGLRQIEPPKRRVKSESGVVVASGGRWHNR